MVARLVGLALLGCVLIGCGNGAQGVATEQPSQTEQMQQKGYSQEEKDSYSARPK